jgi:RND family efflux transporter MFP subunit
LNYISSDESAAAFAQDADGADAIGGRAQDWLVAQCDQLPEARGGLVLLVAGGELTPAALWPNAAGAQPLLELSARAATGAAGLITALPAPAEGSDDPNYGIAWPVLQGDVVLAVAALAVRSLDDAALQPIMRKLQWGAAGLQLLLAQGVSQRERERVETLETSIDLLSAVLAEGRFDGAAISLVTGLATRLNADRVSLGLIENGKIKVEHISHSSQFGENMNLVRMIEAAMDEAVDQRLPILLPADAEEGGAAIRLAHERLLAQEQGSVLTLPLFIEGEAVGALMAERPLYHPFTRAELRTVESLSALAVAALDEKRENDRPLPVKLWSELRQAADVALKPGRTEYKLAIGLGAALVLILVFARGTDNLSASAHLEPRQQIVLAAPFDGYVRSANVRAGDVLHQGQTIATLDDSDLQLERSKWLSQLSRFGGLFQDASAQQDRVQTNVSSSERDEAQSQLNLANSLIARSVLRAPFDGSVVSGDLSQRIGGAVTKGDVLFTVAPREGYRVDLHVKESRIADMKIGQKGTLHLSALPSKPYRFTVAKITPKTVSENGSSYFVVEGALEGGQPLASLQPGMEGVGKIDVGNGWLLGIWTRDLMEWLRLKMWGVFG